MERVTVDNVNEILKKRMKRRDEKIRGSIKTLYKDLNELERML